MKIKNEIKNSGENIVESKRRYSPFLYWGTVVTLVLIVITFVFFPIFTMKFSKDEQLGSLNGKSIYFNDDFRRSWQYQAAYLEYQYKSMYQMEDLPAYFKSSINEQAFNFAFNMVSQQRYILSILDKQNFTISDKKTDKVIADDIINSENPKQALKNYNELSNSEKLLRRDAVKKQSRLEVYSNDIEKVPAITDIEKEFLINFPKEERKIGYVEINKNTIPQSFYSKYAEENSKLWTIVNLKRITTTTKKEIKEAEKKLLEDVSKFDEIANEISIDAEPGKLENKTYFELKKELELKDTIIDEIAALSVNEISKPIKVKFGYIIFKCEKEITPFSLSTFDIEKVKNYIDENDKVAMNLYVKNLIDDILVSAQTKNLKESALENNLEYLETDYFNINLYGSNYLTAIKSGTNSQILAGAQNDTDFFKTVFSLEKDKISDVIYLNDSSIILSVVNIKSDNVKASETITEIVNPQNSLFNFIKNYQNFVDLSKEFYNKYFNSNSFNG